MAWKRAASICLVAAAALMASGCGSRATKGPDSPNPATPAASVDDHSGLWCIEHGVPEDICALCNPKVAAEFKRKGDWCKEHNRPESQCFQCDPKRADKFAADYEAKHGKKPPKPDGA